MAEEQAKGLAMVGHQYLDLLCLIFTQEPTGWYWAYGCNLWSDTCLNWARV